MTSIWQQLMNWIKAQTSPVAVPPAPVRPVVPAFVDGIWRLARHVVPHPNRLGGGAIEPEFVAEHTTDMHPDSFNALVTAWATKPGQGECANLLIGRTPEQGVIQFVPIDRNGNHAGGSRVVDRGLPTEHTVPAHGWLVINGHGVHPNLKAVGIEIHCAGRLRKVDGVWRWGENDGKGWIAKGAGIPAAEVEPITASSGFHLPTAYQLDMLSQLEHDLAVVLHPLTDRNWSVIPNPPDDWPPWARALRQTVPVLGHVHLDPTNREDPGPALCKRISELAWGA